MTDREKVIADIEEQIAWIRDNDFHKFPGWGHAVLAMKDALALLKEQEAVKPKKADNPEESEYCCGICGYPLWLDELYCAHCGRRIEWEGR